MALCIRRLLMHWNRGRRFRRIGLVWVATPLLSMLSRALQGGRARGKEDNGATQEGLPQMCNRCAIRSQGAKPKNADWDEFEPLLVSGPKCKEQLATWRKRLESGGVHSATFAPESVQVETDVSLSWEEAMDINIVEGDGLAVLQVAGAVQRMTDPRGTEHNFVLSIPLGLPSASRKAVW